VGASIAPAAAALALGRVAPLPAAAELRIAGHGFGHGVGLAQWGAYGFAREQGRDFRWILRHYYPGTTLRRVPGRRIRVVLKRAGSAKVCSAVRARDAHGRAVRLLPGRGYRAVPWRGDGLAFIDATTGRRRYRLYAPVRVTGGASTCLRGRAFNERSNRSYRGVLELRRDGPDVLVVNDVALRHYLYGVVPAEMPASWPAGALRAQAVAARSYALGSLRPGAPWDVLPDQSAQVYGGVEEEQPRTQAAVRATDPLALFFGASVAIAYFSSSSGGRTAAVEEGFPGSEPLPYLRSVSDPFDRLSPHHDWSVRLSDRAARRRLGDALDGDLVSLQVVARTPSGRVLTVRVRGTEGAGDVPAATIQARLGLRSAWFTVKRNPEPPNRR
jgi:stage II sporulation protein D